jgi:diaminohydroxyphosphoribosylaminopyrimidine deaminase/5-amino-6-(5-phosphoribosylamino)uracil reductase
MDGPPSKAEYRGLPRSCADADAALFAPLVAPLPAPDGMFVLGRLAQSLDGFIALPSGESHWISGQEDVRHTHRLRSLFDAVVVGAGTVRADNPQLTTRLVEGPSPVRVVIDPARRLSADHRVFSDGPETLVLCAPEASGGDKVGQARVVRVARGDEGLSVRAILTALRERGLRRIFVEGGGVTVSRFLTACALDRLHVTIAPLLVGSGVPAFRLPPTSSLAAGRRFAWSYYQMGADVLMDIPLERAL